MKRFSCGDVVPGCTATWTASSEDDLLVQVAHHARSVHGMTDIPPALVASVRSHIVSVG